MKKLQTMILSAVAVIAAGAMSGCVSKKNYAQLQADYTQLGKDYQSSQVSLAESRAKVQSLEQRLADAQKNNAELKQAYAAVQKSLDNAVYQGGANISKLVDEINSSNRYIQQLVNAKTKSDSQHGATNNLTRSLSRDELRDVDVKVFKGVVYISLADNMLYRSGSYEISDKAMDILGKIAKIIKDYRDYDALRRGQHRQCAHLSH